MPELKLHIKYSKNINTIITPRDLLDLYFYGIDTKAKDGSVIPNHVYVATIMAAQQEVERFLGIKLLRQVIQEDQHYYGADWSSWGLMQTSYPVNECISLTGFYGRQKHISVPPEWLVSKRSSDDMHHRSVWLVPNGIGNLQQSSAVFGGVTPYIRIGNDATVPDYWKLRYITGFDKIPMDLYNLVGMLASLNIFNVLGDLVLGAGIASTSISLDGLSQSIASTSSAENSSYGARITLYRKSIADSITRLKDVYTGIKFTCV